ncbi:ABC1 family-domain-containing protein, partial [Pelagophyceae sp. CCMP2097]
MAADAVGVLKKMMRRSRLRLCLVAAWCCGYAESLALALKPAASMQMQLRSESLGEAPTYESPVLEPVLLSATLSLDEKIEEIRKHYAARPWAVARRLSAIGAAAARVSAAWVLDKDDDYDIGAARLAKSQGRSPEASKRGLVLRREVSQLGVVFVKLAQTLATRPDIVGEEAAAALESLQDSNAPFDDAIALRVIAEDLAALQRRTRLEAPNEEPLTFSIVSETCVAAASLAQVYKATTAGGTDVAIKVRRPGVVEQVALDCHAIRLGLAALQAYWGSDSTDYPAVVDEVTAGLFRELDFRLEARNAPAFWQAHASEAPYLRVPRVYAREVSPRVHVAEWIAGSSLAGLSAERQRDMVAKGLDVCFLQLFGTGFVHADPHYGNMMFDPQNRLVLLDFGLVTELEMPQIEAMAAAVAAVVSEDWLGVLGAFRTMGLLPPTPAVWVDPKTGKPADGLGPGKWQACSEEVFRAGFVDVLAGGGAKAASFTEITARLTRLSLSYQFVLPPWLLFVVRAVITLDGFAAAMDPPLSALEAAAPHAATRVLSPRTRAGERALRAALLVDADAKPAQLDFKRLEMLAQQQQAATGDAAAAGGAVAGDAPTSDVAAKVLALVLEQPGGRALRRLAVDVDSRDLAQRAARYTRELALAPRPSRAAAPPPAPDAHADRRSAMAVYDALGGDDDLFVGLPAPTSRPPAWRRRRVRNLVIATHVRAMLRSRKGAQDLLGLAAWVLLLGLRIAADRAAGHLETLTSRLASSGLGARLASLGRRWTPPRLVTP